MKKFDYSPILHSTIRSDEHTKVQEQNLLDRYLKKQTEEQQALTKITLPDVPESKLEWSLKIRPTIDGRKNIVQYMPMLQRLHEDTWPWIMVKFARQMTKSAYLSTSMGHIMTTLPNQKATYATFEEESLKEFSNNKFRTLWSESEIARVYVDGSTLGSIGSLKTLNNSSASLVTATNNFTHVEGKSVDLLIFDEGQNLDLDAWVTAGESQSFTNGSFIIAGIGGFVDTEYTKWWDSTDQRKWIYNNEYWRSKLEFRKSGTNRLIWDDYLIDVLAGYWKAQKQDNQSKHGYFSNQYQAPWIPLLKSDCEKYGLPIDKSIQWKEENYPQADFIRHVQAGDAAADIKPFTSSMMYALYDKNRSFLKPSEVDYELGDLFFGADWGGANRTVRWIWQYVEHEHFPQFVLINADKLETPDVGLQYDLACEWIDDYEISQAVVDGGGGTHQMQELMKRYGERCLKFYYLKRPNEPEPTYEEKVKYREKNMWSRDKTYLMKIYQKRMTAPYLDGAQKINQIVLPAKDTSKLDWIVEQHTNELTELRQIEGKGTYYERFYTPDKSKRPDDALQAAIFAMEAQHIYGGKSGPIEFTQVEKPDPFGTADAFGGY